MCRYCNCKLLFQTEKGRVYLNKEDKGVDVQFGNIDIYFSELGFSKFQHFVGALNFKNTEDFINPLTRRIVIKPNNHLGGYSFSKEEFVEFQSLVNESRQRIQIEYDITEILGSV